MQPDTGVTMLAVSCRLAWCAWMERRYRTLTTQHLHQQIGIVSQEPVLFADSIFYNIAFGLPRGEIDASLAQVSSF